MEHQDLLGRPVLEGCHHRAGATRRVGGAGATGALGDGVLRLAAQLARWGGQPFDRAGVGSRGASMNKLMEQLSAHSLAA